MTSSPIDNAIAKIKKMCDHADHTINDGPVNTSLYRRGVSDGLSKALDVLLAFGTAEKNRVLEELESLAVDMECMKDQVRIFKRIEILNSYNHV